VVANGVSGFPEYARQCLMVTHAVAGSIPARSTNFLSAERQSAGLNWFRRVNLMVRSSCRTWTLSISVYQTTKAKNIMAKVSGFLKSLVPSFDLGLNFAPATMAA
jgi:hypothetical protein